MSGWGKPHRRGTRHWLDNPLTDRVKGAIVPPRQSMRLVSAACFKKLCAFIVLEKFQTRSTAYSLMVNNTITFHGLPFPSLGRHLSLFRLLWIWLMLKHQLCRQLRFFLTLFNTNSPDKNKQGEEKACSLKALRSTCLVCSLTHRRHTEGFKSGKYFLSNPQVVFKPPPS